LRFAGKVMLLLQLMTVPFTLKVRPVEPPQTMP
jgi:hypothetical protein